MRDQAAPPPRRGGGPPYALTNSPARPEAFAGVQYERAIKTGHKEVLVPLPDEARHLRSLRSEPPCSDRERRRYGVPQSLEPNYVSSWRHRGQTDLEFFVE